MVDFVIPPPVQASAPVRGGGAFPIRRIFCVGRNYADHAKEMGADPAREAPFFFTKPADAVVTGGADTPYPTLTADFQHEVELVVALGRGGVDISADRALEHVLAYAVGLDMTRRDLQAEAKKTARPWDMSKGFDHSAPLSDLVPAAEIGHPTHGAIALSVNGAPRQHGDLGDMIWSVGETIAYLSRLVALAPGDLIFTGTPAGVAAVVKGDHLEAHIEGVGELRTRIS